MGGSGLQNSRWAPKEYDSTSLKRSGDWACPSCFFSNFQWRTQCFKCQATPTGYSEPTATTNMVDTSDKQISVPDWNTTVTRPHITQVHADSKAISAPPPHNPKEKESGLSTSRWAPKSYNGRGKSRDGEVWTRTVSIINTKTTNQPQTLSKPPDLGLPYQVQHYVLAMIQRTLEEACYDYATRWIPQTLVEKGWDCPESVELSTWRELLPISLAPRAIVHVPRLSLTNGLVAAVKIRNAAVHRHLCDNTELKKMARQALDLMVMFSDTTRQEKFYRLSIELDNWDASVEMEHVKREKLQQALIEIGERPIDDMDWTPNDMSLEEVAVEVSAFQGTHEGLDEMEWIS